MSVDDHQRVSLPIIEHQPQPYSGPSREEVLALRTQYLSPGLITYYREPLMIVEGHMQYVYDETGKRYLDAFAGIVTISVGHCHPQVIQRVRQQAGKLQHTTTIYLHPVMAQFAAKLAKKMPEGLCRTYFTNSGSEAKRGGGAGCPRAHRQLGRDCPAQRLSRQHVGADGVNGSRVLEIQEQSERPCAPHARWLLLPLPLRSYLSHLRFEVCS